MTLSQSTLLWAFQCCATFRRQEGKWSRKRDNFANNNFTISMLSASTRSAFRNSRMQNFLINNYDNKRAQLILRPNLCFITFAISLFRQFIFKFLWDPPTIQPLKLCNAISSSGRFRKLRNSQQWKCFYPSDKKYKIHPFGSCAMLRASPNPNDTNGYKLFIIKWFAVVKHIVMLNNSAFSRESQTY